MSFNDSVTPLPRYGDGIGLKADSVVTARDEEKVPMQGIAMSVENLLAIWADERDLYGALTPEERLVFKNNAKGRRDLNKAIAARRGRPRANTARRWRRLADAFLAASCPLQACSIYNDLVDIEPQDADIRAQRGLASLAMYFWDDAIADFEIALDFDDKHVTAKKGLARCKAREEPAVDVNAAFEREVLVPLGKIVVKQRNAGNHDAALIASDLLIELSDDERSWRLRSEVLNGGGRQDDAISCAARALDLGAGVTTRVNYGIMLFNRGEREAALKAFTYAAKYFKTNTWARHWRAYTLSELGRQQEAEKEANSAARAIKKLGEKATAKNHYEVAAMLALTPHLEKGLESLRRAIVIDPTMAAQAKQDDDLKPLSALDGFANIVG